MATTKGKANEKPARETDAWRAALARPHGAARLAELIEDELGDERADQATTERALGLAAVALAPFAATRGRTDAERLVEVILDRWPRWARAPTQRDAFLQHALAVVGARGALAKPLLDAVPDDAAVVVLVTVACLHAAAGAAAPLGRAIEAALDAGATPAQLRVERELADALATPAIAKLIAKREPPVGKLASKAALASAAKAALAELASLGKLLARDGVVHVHGAATPARIAEAAARSPAGFPTEYQALLAAQDGGAYGRALTILGTDDWLADTPLYQHARAYLEGCARDGSPELLACVPIANLGQPSDWILHAPRGIPDDRDARFLYCVDADWLSVASLASAFARVVRLVGNR